MGLLDLLSLAKIHCSGVAPRPWAFTATDGFLSMASLVPKRFGHQNHVGLNVDPADS